MKVLVEYADHPEWNEIVEGDSWEEVVRNVGCTASRLTDITDLPLLEDQQANYEQARKKTGRLDSDLANYMIDQLQRDPDWLLRTFMVIHKLSWADVEPHLIAHKIQPPTFGWDLLKRDFDSPR